MPGSLLPRAETVEQYETGCDDGTLRAGARAMCDRHGLGSVDIGRFEDGSLPVYAVGSDRVLKLYPPVYEHECDIEAGVLETVEGQLPIPTPRVEQVGELDGWSYVLMSRLHGESLEKVWPLTTLWERERLAAELGHVLAALHAITAPGPDQLGPTDWERFVAAQRASCTERQRAAGLDETWLAQIPSFLDGVDLGASPRLALLHTEVMREHLFVTRQADGWTLSGLFDFEPAMRGATEYEFAAAGLFVSCGDADFLRHMLSAYGYAPQQLDEALSQRLLAYALLHRYSNLHFYLQRLPPPAASTLDALATCWWGFH